MHTVCLHLKDFSWKTHIKMDIDMYDLCLGDFLPVTISSCSNFPNGYPFRKKNCLSGKNVNKNWDLQEWKGTERGRAMQESRPSLWPPQAQDVKMITSLTAVYGEKWGLVIIHGWRSTPGDGTIWWLHLFEGLSYHVVQWPARDEGQSGGPYNASLLQRPPPLHGGKTACHLLTSPVCVSPPTRRRSATENTTVTALRTMNQIRATAQVTCQKAACRLHNSKVLQLGGKNFHAVFKTKSWKLILCISACL